MIAGFIAQKIALADAACLGVVIHGLAAEAMSKHDGTRGMLATDLWLPLRKLINNSLDAAIPLPANIKNSVMPDIFYTCG